MPSYCESSLIRGLGKKHKFVDFEFVALWFSVYTSMEISFCWEPNSVVWPTHVHSKFGSQLKGDFSDKYFHK